jgi:hypothetical protein
VNINDTADLELVKAAMRNVLPAVKSSWRCAAFARAAGFSTYAALQTAVPCNVVLSEALGMEFLMERDCDLPSKCWTKVVTKMVEDRQ